MSKAPNWLGFVAMEKPFTTTRKAVCYYKEFAS
jgi:hypothetical protein